MLKVEPASADKLAQGGRVDEQEDAFDSGFKPLSAEQAQQWRAAHPPISPWPGVGAQAAAGLVTVALAWLVSAGKMSVTWSAAYGVLAAWLPAAMFARMAARRMRMQTNAASALLALAVWEAIKIALTVALLLAAPKMLGQQVHWLALLAGFVVTIKAAWVALWLMSARRLAAQAK